MNKILRNISFPLCFLIAALLARFIVLDGHENAVQVQAAVVHPGFENTPLTVRVYPTPHKAWELTKELKGSSAWEGIGVVLFWLAIAFIVVAQLDVLPLKLGYIIVLEFLLLAAWLACRYTAYSGVISNTYREVTKDQYDQANDGHGGLDALFDDGVKPIQ